jgi:UPF0042 nucleotide-binding protein
VNKLKLLIITGLSGSGKSTAMAALEDAGFYCVDNMPVDLLPKLLELPIEQDTEFAGLAFVMDLREKRFLEKYTHVFDSLGRKGYFLEVVFLEANEEVLLKRYSQTRRHHPMSHVNTLLDSIRNEKDKLSPLKEIADHVINTSHCNVHELKQIVLNIAQKKITAMQINILSFGFKYGIPPNADLIIDVRFLTNPYFVPELKELDGETDSVQAFVLNNETAKVFLEKYLNLLDYLIPLYKKEGKAYLTISIGCTGGMHRSVAVARYIYEHIKKTDGHVGISHRDVFRRKKNN